jgi:hypothetical protein
VTANKSIDTDVLSVGFARLLPAGHLQRYASGAVASVPRHLSRSQHSVSLWRHRSLWHCALVRAMRSRPPPESP